MFEYPLITTIVVLCIVMALLRLVKAKQTTPVKPAPAPYRGPTPKPAGNPVNAHNRIGGLGVGLTPKSALIRRQVPRKKCTNTLLGTSALSTTVLALDEFMDDDSPLMDNSDPFQHSLLDDNMDTETADFYRSGLGEDSSMQINPATGLPMISGIGSVDVAGNPWGTDLSSTDLSLHDSLIDSHTFNDSDIFTHSIDDSFSSGFNDDFDTFSSFDIDDPFNSDDPFK